MGGLTVNTAHGHASAGSDKSRKGLAVGSDEFAAFSGVFLLLVKVEDEILILGQKGKAVCGAV